jgi:hypothetical protein
MIIADLKLPNATDGRPPRQLRDDFAPAGKRVEGHAMLGGPAIFCGSREYGSFVSNIRVLKRELPHAEVGELIDVPPNKRCAVNIAATHYAGGPDGQAASRVKELPKTRRR